MPHIVNVNTLEQLRRWSLCIETEAMGRKQQTGNFRMDAYNKINISLERLRSWIEVIEGGWEP